MHVDQTTKAMRNAEIEDFIEVQAAHLPRHADQWGTGAGLVEPEWLEWSMMTSIKEEWRE
jgi:hypothetical protein